MVTLQTGGIVVEINDLHGRFIGFIMHGTMKVQFMLIMFSMEIIFIY